MPDFDLVAGGSTRAASFLFKSGLLLGLLEGDFKNSESNESYKERERTIGRDLQENLN